MRWWVALCLVSCSPPREKSAPSVDPVAQPVIDVDAEPDEEPDADQPPQHNEPWSRTPRYQPPRNEEEANGAPEPPPRPRTNPRVGAFHIRAMRMELHRRCDQCGSYNLTITGDSRVVFRSNRGRGGRGGTQQGTISFPRLAAMIVAFERVDFFGFKEPKTASGCRGHYYDEYEITLELYGNTRTMRHDNNCRAKPALAHLQWLVNEIDRLSDTSAYLNGTMAEQATLYCAAHEHPRGCVQWVPPEIENGLGDEAKPLVE